MTIRLDAPAVTAIHAHARRAYPDECCGALMGTVSSSNVDDRHVLVAMALENEETQRPGCRFLISAGQLGACEAWGAQQGLDVIGFYHSHPDAAPLPSFVDRALGWPWYCFVIASVYQDDVGPIRAWMLRDDRSDFAECEIALVEYAQ